MLALQANTSAASCLYSLSTPASLTASVWITSLWWLMRKLLGFLSFALPRHQASIPQGWTQMCWKQRSRSTSCTQHSKQETRGKAAWEARNQTSALPVQSGLHSSPLPLLSPPSPGPLLSLSRTTGITEDKQMHLQFLYWVGYKTTFYYPCGRITSESKGK